MSTATWFQVAGGVSEAIGLILVAWGISQTRQEFLPDRPFILVRGWRVTRTTLVRLWPGRDKSKVIHLGAARSFETAGSFFRGKVTLGPWTDVKIEEQIERLKEMVSHLDDRIDRIEDYARAETRARAEADSAERAATVKMEEELDDRIRRAAAGGLRNETLGVLFFLGGVGLSTFGNIIS